MAAVVWRSGLLLMLLVGCGSAPGDGPVDDGGAGDGDGAAPRDGAVASTDGAPARDSSVVSPDGGPGPGPTQSCPFTKDSLGFFDLASPMSPYTVHLPAN